MVPPSKTFRDLFCEHFACPPEEFEQRVFWRCLHRRTLPLAALIYFLNRDFFKRDFDTIRQLGVSRRPGEFQKEVEDYYFGMRSYGNLLQQSFRVRISGQRLMRLERIVRHATADSADSAASPAPPPPADTTGSEPKP